MVDHAGVRVSRWEKRVAFQVVSGPAFIVGVGSGDPASHVYQQGVVADTFLGSVKVQVRVNIDCVTAGRKLAARIDLEQGKGEGSVTVASDCTEHLQAPIVVQATTTDGLTATASVQVSGDVATDGWFAVARATGRNLTYTFMEDFVE